MTICGWQFFEKEIFFSDEAHITLGGHFNKQNCRIWGSENPQMSEERPLHSEKDTVLCALWSEWVFGWDTAQYVSKSGRKLPQKNQCLEHLAWKSLTWCSVWHIMSTFKLYNKKKYFICVLFTSYLLCLFKVIFLLPNMSALVCYLYVHIHKILPNLLQNTSDLPILKGM